MFVCEVLRQLIHEPVIMLDLCSAPGGKSTAAASVLPDGSLIVSNEPISNRASILTENIQKWGSPNSIVTRNYPKDYAKSGQLFDVILTDVPCSGEGMFRKDHNAVNEWSAQHVRECVTLQRDIVEQAWHCLRPGGLLIYSTCTINAHEDEENVEWICRQLGAVPQPVCMDSNWGIAAPLMPLPPADKQPTAPNTPYAFRFLPGEVQGEGLFMAVLRKPGEMSGCLLQTAVEQTGKDRRKRHKQRKTADPKSAIGQADAWLAQLHHPDDYTLRMYSEGCRAIPTAWLPIYDRIADKLHVLHAGVPLAVIKGHDWVPAAALPLSTALRPDAFPRVELTYTEALTYLRREAVRLPDGTPQGYVVVCYHDHPLGWEKNMGHRANNGYPMEWRIKSTHLPEQPVNILNK